MSDATSIWHRKSSEKTAFLAAAGVPVAAESATVTPGRQEDPKTLDSEGKVVLSHVDPQVDHILKTTWTFWFLHRGPGVKISNYLRATSNLGNVSTVEQFWQMYLHLTPINRLPYTSEYLLFREGVNPVWEDPVNVTGGKWVVHLKRHSGPGSTKRERAGAAAVAAVPALSGLSERSELSSASSANTTTTTTKAPVQLRHLAALSWEKLMLAIIGGTFAPELESDEIVGIVASARRDEDILSVWNRSLDETVTQAIKNALVTVFDGVLDVSTLTFEYKVHQESIKEGAEKQASYEQRHHQHQHQHQHPHHHHHHHHHGSQQSRHYNQHSTSHPHQHQHQNQNQNQHQNQQQNQHHNQNTTHRQAPRPLHSHANPHPSPHSPRLFSDRSSSFFP